MDNQLNQQLESFQNSFSKEQKAAIIGCLIVIANCDSQINDKEERNIENIAKMLNISLADNAFNDSQNSGMEYMMKKLNSLDRNQKEWFAVSILELIISDGPPAEIENSYAIGISGDIGISEGEYVSIIQKARALEKKYVR